MAKLKHYKKPEHKILDEEDKEILDKEQLIELDKKLTEEEGFLKRLFSFGRKKNSKK